MRGRVPVLVFGIVLSLILTLLCMFQLGREEDIQLLVLAPKAGISSRTILPHKENIVTDNGGRSFGSTAISTANSKGTMSQVYVRMVNDASPSLLKRILSFDPESEELHPISAKQHLLELFPQANNLSEEAKFDFMTCTETSAARLGILSPEYYRLERSNVTHSFECIPLREMTFIPNIKSRRMLSSHRIHPLTALASFPGSGNTWLRYLLEQSTGVFTGSLECDMVLKAAGHLGEGISSNNVLAVKTHFASVELNPTEEIVSRRLFKAAIVLIRNPYQSIWSEYQRKTLWSHTKELDTHDLKINLTDWNSSFTSLLHNWYDFYRFWLNFTALPVPAAAITYSDLMRNRKKTLLKVLHFLNVPYSKLHVECTSERLYSLTFKRPSCDCTPYTAHQLEMVNKTVTVLSSLLKQHNIAYQTWTALFRNW